MLKTTWIALVLTFVTAAVAQSSAPSAGSCGANIAIRGAMATPTTALHSPKVHPDRNAAIPHGNCEAQNSWAMNGRANIILDNLIADKKAQPMIVVMPQGHARQGASVGPLRSAYR